MIRASLGEIVSLGAVVADGLGDLYCRAYIYTSSGTLVTTEDLNYVGSGLYANTYTFSAEGYFHVVYRFYTDSGYVDEADYDVTAETYEVNSDKNNLVKLLGLTHDNVVIDSHTYDSQGNLLTSRIRHYASKAQAQAAGASGLLATWTVAATYSSGRLLTYRLVREP